MSASVTQQAQQAVQQAITSTNNLLTQTGNRVVVEIGGQAVGLIRSCRLSEDYGLEGAYGIGDIDPLENVPTRAVYSVAVQGLALINNGLRSIGAVPENSDVVLQGLVLDFVVYSKLTGLALRKMSSASYVSGDTDITANAIIVSSGMFRGLGISGTGL